MKKITLCLMLILALIIVPGAMFATEGTAEVDTYQELVDALADSTKTTIKLVGGFELDSTIAVTRSVTIINGGDYKITTKSGVEKSFEIKNTTDEYINVKFEGVTIINATSEGRCIDTRNDKINLTLSGVKLETTSKQNNQALTLGGTETTGNLKVEMINSSATSAGEAGYGIITFVPGELLIKNSSVSGYAALYVKEGSSGLKVNVIDSGLNGINNASGDTDDFGTIVLEESNITVNIGAEENNSFISAQENGKACEYIILDEVGGNTITVSDTVIEMTNAAMLVNSTTKITLGDMTEIYAPSIAKYPDALKSFMPENAIYKDLGDNWYSIHEKNTIKVNNPKEGGKIEVIPSSAYAGDIAEIKVTVDDGYKLERIFYGGSRQGGSTIEGDALLADKITFEVPDGKVSMTPVFTKTEMKVSDTVENKEEVQDMLFEAYEKLVKEDSDLAEKVEGKNIDIIISDPTPIPVEEEEGKLIQKEAAKKVEDIKIAQYMDISIVIIDADTEEKIDNLTSVKKAIKFTVEVPEEIKTAPTGYNRIYYIIRNHNGVIDVWETEEVDGKLTFESDKFSTYAIAYKDVKDETTSEGVEGGVGEAIPQPEAKPSTPDVPKTGDNVVVYVALAVVAMAGMAVTIKMKRK